MCCDDWTLFHLRYFYITIPISAMCSKAKPGTATFSEPFSSSEGSGWVAISFNDITIQKLSKLSKKTSRSTSRLALSYILHLCFEPAFLPFMPDRYPEAYICPVSQKRVHTCHPLTYDLTQGARNNPPTNKSVAGLTGRKKQGKYERGKRKGGHVEVRIWILKTQIYALNIYNEHALYHMCQFLWQRLQL